MINTTAFHQSIHQSSHNDEYLTPPEAVRIVLPYVQGKRIWCPFDNADSAFVQVSKSWPYRPAQHLVGWARLLLVCTRRAV